MDDVGKLLQQLVAEGWDAFDPATLKAASENQLQAETLEARRQAAIVGKALGNDAGADFLDWLLRKTLLRPASPAEIAETDPAALGVLSARRQGQNQVVYMILSALATARGEKPEAGGDVT